ncbi:MAG: transcriptional regulator [Desulfovibrio sp.]|nr:MAG: transcriptional regulator [Desulfovibrio sp.]
MSERPHQSNELRKNVLARLRRIEGQIRGIQSMIEADKDCADILIQVKAVMSALRAANTMILKRYIVRCFMDLDSLDIDPEAEAKLEELAQTLSSFLDK